MGLKEEPTALKDMVADQVTIFARNRDTFDALRKIIIATLHDKAASLPGSPLIQGRVKETGSFSEKCVRKCDKYSQPAWQLTDLCGVRVVVNSLDAIPPVRQCIEEHFLVLEDENTAERLGEMEFGYQSVHYIVALDPAKRRIYSRIAGRISPKLFSARDPAQAQRELLPAGPVFRAEIQVRSLLQHAWSDAIHDCLYKTEMKHKPHHLLRESALVAALLEDADNSIVKLAKGADFYRSYYGAYMKPSEIAHEIELQRIILAHDPHNLGAALKIARLSDCLERGADTRSVEKDLVPFKNSGNSTLLRELGMVRLKNGKVAAGRRDILASTNVKSDDPDAWCELGLSYFQEKDYGRALDYYQKAFEADPYYPRSLMRFIECKILDGSDGTLEFLPLIKQNLERAVDDSYRRIATGIHIPHAWYDIGFFTLLLNRQDESVEAYGKAILATSSARTVVKVYESLTEIHRKTCRKNIALNSGLRLIRSYLRVVLVGRFDKKPEAYLTTCNTELDGFSTLSPCHRDNKSALFKKGRPVVIVAGACSRTSGNLLGGYAEVIKATFEGFAGIICCGGTDAGISGMVGHLDNLDVSAVRLGYLPKGERCMNGYECIHTPAGDFSLYEPIMMWSDLLACGVAPGSVRVLGVGGGRIACLEYQLAILLGAQVGILEGNGANGSSMLEDREWRLATAVPPSSHKPKVQLLRLPADVATLRSFIYPPHQSALIEETDREAMAASMHESYRFRMREKAAERLQNLADWQNLDPTFKEANYGFVDHIDCKLAHIGLTVRKNVGKTIEPYEFNEAEIQTLAEMEHGRWVVDRLEDGWRLGPRDDARRTRPQLIPWRDLDSLEKEKDVKAIVALPKMLADEGYEIVSMPERG